MSPLRWRRFPLGSVHDDHGRYVTAAVLASPDLRSTAEKVLRDALPADRLPHWHIEDALPATGSPPPWRTSASRRGSTRAATRTAGVRALGWSLVDVDEPIGEIVLDRRQETQNRKDGRVLDVLLPNRGGPGYRHAPTSSEPLLWTADIVVGAVCATWFRGADHLGRLGRALSRCEREPG